jgi:Tfp pilus assembly protein PilX
MSFKNGRKSEQGFVLIVALFAMLLIIALGIYALNMSTNDIFVSTRMVGERRAFSASESCWNIFAATYDPSTYDPNSSSAPYSPTIDSNDNDLRCNLTSTTIPSTPISLSGYEASGGETWVYLTWQLIVDGYDDRYLGHEQSQSVVGYGPVLGSTEYK